MLFNYKTSFSKWRPEIATHNHPRVYTNKEHEVWFIFEFGFETYLVHLSPP